MGQTLEKLQSYIERAELLTAFEDLAETVPYFLQVNAYPKCVFMSIQACIVLKFTVWNFKTYLKDMDAQLSLILIQLINLVTHFPLIYINFNGNWASNSHRQV